MRTVSLLFFLLLEIVCVSSALAQQPGEIAVVASERAPLQLEDAELWSRWSLRKGAIVSVVAARNDQLFVVYKSNPTTSVANDSGVRVGVGGWINRADLIPLAKAPEFFERLAKQYPSASAYENLGIIWVENGDLAKAVAAFDESAQIAPNDPRARIRRKVAWLACLQTGEFDKATNVLDETLRVELDHAKAYALRGDLWLGTRESDKAMTALNEVMRDAPNAAAAYKVRAQVLFFSGEAGRAIADFCKGACLDAEAAAAREHAGLAPPFIGDDERVIIDYETPFIVYEAPLEHKRIEFTGPSLPPFEPYAEKPLNDYHLFVTGEYDKLIADCSEAIQADPTEAAHHVGRGRAWYAKGNYDKAIADFTAAIARQANYPRVYSYRGNAYRESGVYDRALEDYDEAIRIADACNDRAFALSNRGLARMAQGNIIGARSDFDSATAEYTNAMQQNSSFATPYCGRGEAWQLLGDYAQAIADYNQAIEFSPDLAVGWNARAWLAATCLDAQFRNGKQAVVDATKACEVTTWHDPQYLSTLAAACAETGDFASAQKWQDKAIGLASEPLKSKLRARLELYKARKPYRK